MRILIIAAVLTVIAGIESSAEPIPQVVCRAGKVVWVYPTLETFRSTTTANDTEYEIVGKDLFIDPPERSRYLYNKITAVEDDDSNRFQSAHYTLIFSSDRRRLTLIHSNEQAVRVISTTCALTKR